MSASPHALHKLYVEGIDRDTTICELKSYFERYGAVVYTTIVCDTVTKMPRGFGIVTFEQADAVDAVLADSREFGPLLLGGCLVEVKRSIPYDYRCPTAHHRTNRIFVDGLMLETEESDLHGHFEARYRQYGTVSEVAVIRDRATGHSKGCGFITFDNQDVVDRIILERASHIIDGAAIKIVKTSARATGQSSQTAALRPAPAGSFREYGGYGWI
ncbi:MAG: hypothetical protein AAGC55_15535 [Myxococcota bacterium]